MSLLLPDLPKLMLMGPEAACVCSLGLSEARSCVPLLEEAVDVPGSFSWLGD